MGKEFEGRGVIVTSAGSGIGPTAALQFASQGAGVLIADINPVGAEAVTKQIEASGGTARTVIGDLSDQRTVDEVITTAVESFGHLSVLVNNAGIMDSMTATADVSDAEWEQVIRINLTAPFLLTRAALPHLLAHGNGAIVNTASEAALRGSTAGTAYTASKHGIIGLTKSTAVMYRDRGVRVNAIAPGSTDTPSRTRSPSMTTAPPSSAAAGRTWAAWPRRRKSPRPSCSSPLTREQHHRRRAPGRQRVVGRLIQPLIRRPAPGTFGSRCPAPGSTSTCRFKHPPSS